MVALVFVFAFPGFLNKFVHVFSTFCHIFRYIRVFCKEIFLKKSNEDDKSFWLSQFLKPFPIFFRARLLYILYGPIDDDSGIY